MMRMERKSMIISEEEKKTTAYHELVTFSLQEWSPSWSVHKVTIIPEIVH